MKKVFFCVMGLLVAGAVMVNGAGLMELSSGNVLVDTCKTVTSAPAHILAYDLTADSTATGYDFSFKANMAANSAALVFFNEAGDSIGTIAIPSVAAGANVVTVQTDAFPNHGREMRWAVRLTGPDNASFAMIFESAKISGRLHLAVDANPESPYMGQAYVFGRNNVQATGLYIMDQQYNLSARHNFGLTQINSGFMRPCVDENGMVWVPDQTAQRSGIWIIDPANPDTCVQFFQGTLDGIGMFMNGDTRVGGPGTTCFLYGKGENRKLFAHQEDNSDFMNPVNAVAIYNIGTSYSWNTAPTTTHDTQNHSAGNSALYVVKQGYWISQFRNKSQNTATYPALQFFAMDGTPLASFGGDPRIDGCAVAGMTLDTVHNRLYLADGLSNILEFDVTYNDTTNVPTLDLVGKHLTNYQNIASMSLDYAGNLYVTGGGYGTSSLNKMQVAVFSPATNGHNSTLVPARKPIYFREDPTRINHIEGQEQAVRFIRNGQLFIRKNGITYDAIGRVVR